MGVNGRFPKLKFSFHRSPHPPTPPPEFICPICNSLISDPVVVSSGHTFDSLCATLCISLDFSPDLPDGSSPDLSRLIPNLALKSTIHNWCSSHGLPPPSPPDRASVERIVRGLKDRAEERELIDAVADVPPSPNFSHAVTEVNANNKINRFDSPPVSTSSSDESVIVDTTPTPTPFPLATRPACFSYSSASTSSSSEISDSSNPNPSSEEEDEFLTMLRSADVTEVQNGAFSLRKATRSADASALRISLCTPRILSAVRSLLTDRRFDGGVRTDAAAVVVNLSLEKANKVRIVRSGILPALIDVLKTPGEAAEHAAGAVFSLALEDDNKTAIGVLGALPPLMHCFTRSESERARHDAALALYHLTLVQSNRAKLVKMGAVPALLAMLSGAGAAAGKALLVLCNLGAAAEGRSAMLDRNAVECLVAMLRRGEFDSESARENCVAAMYALSHGSMRFKGLARDAGAAEVLRGVVEDRGSSERAREKARRILVAMKGERDGGGGERAAWERVLGSGASGVNSSKF